MSTYTPFAHLSGFISEAAEASQSAVDQQKSELTGGNIQSASNGVSVSSFQQAATPNMSQINITVVLPPSGPQLFKSRGRQTATSATKNSSPQPPKSGPNPANRLPMSGAPPAPPQPSSTGMTSDRTQQMPSKAKDRR